MGRSRCAIVISAGLGPVLGLALALVAIVPYMVVSAAPPAALRKIGLPSRPVAWLSEVLAEEGHELAGVVGSRRRHRRDVITALTSLAAVVTASAFMEQSAQALGAHFHLSNLVVGGLVLAGVTSLPNAVGAVFLASRARGTALLSEAMNSNMLNVLVGLLLPGVFIGLAGPSGQDRLVVAWYAGLTLASLLMAFGGRGLGRRSGFAIVTGYVAFATVAIIR